ncbi:TetR/AcrR family transcriptional regulator [Polymorphospora sp. NPDC050346]|uniref:TetR/AcrR family transcriptional regulator n=1 Tax=Polymorphospora sp. NPDC050346 TaxID=3155780 RepID=UPI0033E6F44F
MPRGVAIPQIRQHLFAAVERVIVRDGPGRLNGRAITGEAAVATGLLYAHFADLDDFLAGYAVDRTFSVSAHAAALPERAGTGDIAANLCDAALATPPATLTALTRLLVARPDLIARVHAVLGDDTSGIDAIEGAVTTYLTEEQRLGRLAAAVQPAPLALAVVGVLHRLALTADTGSDLPASVRQAVTALVGNFTTAVPRR